LQEMILESKAQLWDSFHRPVSAEVKQKGFVYGLTFSYLDRRDNFTGNNLK
jgi:hypothetical protein